MAEELQEQSSTFIRRSSQLNDNSC